MSRKSETPKILVFLAFCAMLSVAWAACDGNCVAGAVLLPIGVILLIACFPCFLVFVFLVIITSPIFFVAWPVISVVCMPVTIALILIAVGISLLT